MKEIILNKEDRLLQIINKALASQTSELKIVIPEESILFKNILNLKIFQRVLDSAKIIAKFETQSLVGKTMLTQVRNNDRDEADFSKYQESFKEKDMEEKILEEKKEKVPLSLPKFSFPKIQLPNFKMLPFILGAGLLVFGLGYYFLVVKLTANVDIQVSAERFVKSFEIKVSSLQNTDVAQKILKAEKFSTVFQASKEIPTTGKIEAGKKAEGELKLLNKTDKAIKVSKDTKIVYKDSGKEYIYYLTDSIDVPARTLTSTSPETFVSGEKVSKAVASTFGSSYNLAAGKTLTVSSNNVADLSAIVSSSFEGGVKNMVNAVSVQDLKDVSSGSLDDFKAKFVFNSDPNKIALKNSESFIITNQKFSALLSDPADKISVTQDINVSYLVYDYTQALAFVKASIKSLIPEGYELYGRDLQIELSSLGSPTGVNIDSKEANAQLTIKSYKIPLINENEIKANLAGKKLSEVAKYLDSLNVSYNIESSSGLLNLFGFPKDTSKINVNISKQK